MKTDLQIKNAAEIETECLVVAVVDKGDKDKSIASVLTSERPLQDAAQELIALGELSGKALELAMLYRPAGIKARRVLFVGGGKEGKFNPNELRKIAGAAARHLKSKNIRSLAIALPSGVHFHTDNAIRAAVIGVLIADFDPDIYKSDRKDQRLQSLTIVAPSGDDEKLLRSALEEARIIGESQNFARELVNEPGNRLTPMILGERARTMAAETGLQCEVLGPDQIKALKMGAFWSVAQGSDEPPALIVLKYAPAGASGPVLGLVGKAITFDTGGISIKPADGMEKMKYDMAGGAAMLGAMRAVAQLKPKVKVNAVICASENMPSGKAQKPGDVQIAMSGKSIEIINTDAEGRLVLADGLTYARTKLGCTHLVDAATLTGACVVALGMVNAGIFANDDSMYERFQKALHQAGEKMWRLPLDDEYRDNIKSNIADMVNSGGRYGGAVTAAMFLKEFVDDKPWIHLDIAGTAWIDEAKPFIAKGPSGIAVRSLIEFVRGFETQT